jgi:hypothetical protein
MPNVGFAAKLFCRRLLFDSGFFACRCELRAFCSSLATGRCADCDDAWRWYRD